MLSYTASLSSITAEDDWDRAMDMNREEFRDRCMALLPPVAAEEDLEHTKETGGEALERSLTFLSRTTTNEDVDRAEAKSEQPMTVYFDYALRQYVSSETTPYLRGWLRPASSLAPLAQAGLPLYPIPSNPFHSCCSMSNEYTCSTKSIATGSLPGDRIHLLAARIPLELLDIIVSYLGDCVGITEYGPAFALRRKKNSNDIKDSCQPLRSCSLVCRRWANICRYGLFSGATLVFTSSKVWEEFVAYASSGCPSLVPIYKLIDTIRFIQCYQSPKPAFCYRIRDVPRGMLDHIYLRLDLLGPVPPTFPPGMLSTPHWSTPPTLTTPHSLLHPFYTISVTNVHMPSLLHVLKFIRYVAHISSVYDPHSKVVDKEFRDPAHGSEGVGLHLNKLTWDSGKRQHYPFRFRSPYLSRLRPYDPQAFANFFCQAYECTNNIRLCTYAAIAHPGCWMHWLPKAEQEWILALMESLEDSFVDVTCNDCFVFMPEARYRRWQNTSGIRIMEYCMQVTSIESEEEPGQGKQITLTLYFEALPRDTTTKTSVRILGLLFEFTFSWFQGPLFNMDKLIQQLRKKSPPRRADDKIVILVHDFYDHKSLALIERYRPSILIEEHNYLLSCRTKEKPSRVVAVNPVTMALTGQSWERSQDGIPALCNIPFEPA